MFELGVRNHFIIETLLIEKGVSRVFSRLFYIDNIIFNFVSNVRDDHG